MVEGNGGGGTITGGAFHRSSKHDLWPSLSSPMAFLAPTDEQRTASTAHLPPSSVSARQWTASTAHQRHAFPSTTDATLLVHRAEKGSPSATTAAASVVERLRTRKVRGRRRSPRRRPSLPCSVAAADQTEHNTPSSSSPECSATKSFFERGTTADQVTPPRCSATTKLSPHQQRCCSMLPLFDVVRTAASRRAVKTGEGEHRRYFPNRPGGSAGEKTEVHYRARSSLRPSGTITAEPCRGVDEGGKTEGIRRRMGCRRPPPLTSAAAEIPIVVCC
nr:hypothetical protein Iba_chr15dCG7100 [Ipomoea batatas]